MRGIRNTAILLSVGSRRAGFSARLAPDDPEHDLLDARLAEPERTPVPAERTRTHHGATGRDLDDLTPPDPALVEHVQGLLHPTRAQQAEPRVDAEHVEAVMRKRTRGHRVDQLRPDPAGPGPEPLLHRTTHQGRADLVQQGVADPVRLHHPRIERVADPGRTRDQLQVRPGALEPLREVPEVAVVDPGRDMLEELARLVRPAVPV